MSKNHKNQTGRMPLAKGMDMASVYAPGECGKKAENMVLSEDNTRILEEFITILGMKDRFEEHGVPIPNKIVMYGPPGTGKTLTAFYLSHRLGLPLVIVRLDTLIHAHLGETGSNVRRIFEYAKAKPCILFLDEFDAIARTRDNNDEVKEMARVVNTLLQCLDEFHGESVFIAATNLEQELDNAIWRRFDTKMNYEIPDEDCRKKYIHLLFGEFERERGAESHAIGQLAGCSYADIEQIILKAKRKSIIEGAPLSCQAIETACREYRPQRW